MLHTHAQLAPSKAPFLHPFAKLAPPPEKQGAGGEPAYNGPLRVHVHDVEPAQELRMRRVDKEELFERLAASRSDDTCDFFLEGCSHDYLPPADLEACPFVQVPCENVLIAAAHQAYCKHLPLAIQPDVLWLCILQGLAHHVVTYVPTGKDNPVTGQEEKIPLYVDVNYLELGPAGRGVNNWGFIIDQWCSQIQRHIGERLPAVCHAMQMKFSTTTQVSATAFNITFMAALKNYFDCMVGVICGIPYVELHGTKQDYEHMMEALDVLDEIARIGDCRSWKDKGMEGPRHRGIDLMAWKRELKAVLAHFVAAFDQDPKEDRDFWTRIYRYHEGTICGDPGSVTGWISKFLPYLEGGKVNRVAEGAIPPDPAPDPGSTVKKHWSDEGGYREHYEEKPRPARSQCLDFDAFGPIMSDVPFKFKISEDKELPMALASGLVGVRQDQSTGVLSPEIGWLVAHTKELPGGKTRPQLKLEALDRLFKSSK